jgi:UDP-N-acetyl-D-mannosaminuronic acid transferase (WecB/TagA/CpsF family)
MKMRVLEEQETVEQANYKKAILAADILFPDGIALQVFDWAANKGKSSWLHNLNGTDFVPYFLKYLAAK